MKVQLSGTATEVEEFDIEDLATINQGWEYEDGYYYYNSLLEEDEETSPLFDEVKIPTTWGNEFVEKKLTILITAEAVQADNLAADSAQAAFAETAPAPAPTTTTAE